MLKEYNVFQLCYLSEINMKIETRNQFHTVILTFCNLYLTQRKSKKQDQWKYISLSLSKNNPSKNFYKSSKEKKTKPTVIMNMWCRDVFSYSLKYNR